jgi:hypothetical protein
MDAQAAWTVPDLQDIVDEWLLAGWQARPHDTLRIVITWVFNRTGESLPLSVLVHVSNNNALSLLSLD